MSSSGSSNLPVNSSSNPPTTNPQSNQPDNQESTTQSGANNIKWRDTTISAGPAGDKNKNKNKNKNKGGRVN